LGIGLAVVGLVTGVSAEVFARFVLRLGDPPLYVADKEVEYLMVPSRRYERFYQDKPLGKPFVSEYNQWSMRSPEFGKAKGRSSERRVLVIGDSVVNGGPQCDQADLATTLLATDLATPERPAVVANIACGSWGPPNQLAYVRKFGTFEADVAVIVLNHEDASDVPTFAPLGRDFPTRTPVLALEEALFRYVPLWLESRGWLGGGRGASVGGVAGRDEAKVAADTEVALQAVRDLVGVLRGNGVKVAAVLHAAQSELGGTPRAGTVALRRCLTALDVPVLTTIEAANAALATGMPVYRDDIHLNPPGQRVLAGVLKQGVEQAR
jgi:hypothetical protein